MGFRLLLALLFALLVGSRAAAELVEIDLVTPGDGLVTRDTVTGLDWLDLTETTLLSYTDVVTGAGGYTAAGWRHATGDEVCALFANELAPVPCPDGNAAVFSQFTQVVSLLGVTWVLNEGPGHFAYYAIGAYDDGDAGDGLVGNGSFAWGEVTGVPRTEVGVHDDQINASEAASNRGNFLVRSSPVPVPSLSAAALALLALTLTLAAWARGAGRGRNAEPGGGRLRSVAATSVSTVNRLC